MDIREALEIVGDKADIAVANIVYNKDEMCTIVKGNGMQSLHLLALMIKAMANDKGMDPKLIIAMLSELIELEEDDDETASDDSESEGGSFH